MLPRREYSEQRGPRRQARKTGYPAGEDPPLYPVIPLFGLPLPGYGLMVGLGILLGSLVRRQELRRLGYGVQPGHRWVGVGALIGAMFGSKIGMLLFLPAADFQALVEQMLSLDFTGKTVVGGMFGGYLGVEITKKIVGIRESTGDGFAVGVAVAQGVGRIGCLLNGCCFGEHSELPWALSLGDGIPRHPAPLYESLLTLGLAAWLWSIRTRPRPRGRLFRYFLIGFAAIRLGMEFLRGDNGWSVGPLTAVQWVCVATIVGFGALIWREDRGGVG